MKKLRVTGAILIILSLILMLLPAKEAVAKSSASDFVVKSGELVKYNGKSSVVTIPDTVTSIGTGAFEDNEYVRQINLSKSVKKIDPYAFWNCGNLQTVMLGTGLTAIGDYAFTNCTGLESISIPSNVKSIGIQAFSNCPRFESIYIPYTVMDISEDAFDEDLLLSIEAEEGTYAYKYAIAFYERQKKMTGYGAKPSPRPEINVYDSEDYVPKQPAGDNSTYTIIIDEPGKNGTVPQDGVYSGADVPKPDENAKDLLGSSKVVSNQAFVIMQNSGLVRDGNDGGTENGQGEAPAEAATGNASEADLQKAKELRPHYRDTELRETEFEPGTTEITAFSYARSGLEKVILPDGLEKIGYAAFYMCEDLEQVEIPDSVKEVSAQAFAHTRWVRKFLEETGGADDFLVSGGVLIAYRGNGEEVTVPDGVRVISGDAFKNHEEIKMIHLPDSLESIDEDAFRGCSIENTDYQGSGMEQDLIEERVLIRSEAQGPLRDAGGPFCMMLIAGLVMIGGIGCLAKSFL